MIKKRLAAVSAIFILFLVSFFFLNNKYSKRTVESSRNPKTTKVYINQKEIIAEIADNEPLRQKGLSGRKSLDTDRGMLFVFDKKDVLPIFWMKDMLIHIDIIWINDGKIIGINEKVPPPESLNIPDTDLTKYPSPGLTDYVLEMGSGFSETNNIKTGDTVAIDL